MSQQLKVTNKETKSQRPSKYSAGEASKIFTQIDSRLQSLSDHLLPKQPYLISLPSDVPYRRHLHDPNTWHLGTPFSRDEEQLQYMSFLPKDGEDEELLKAEGEWADDSGNWLAWDSSSQTDYTSQPNTPAAHTPIPNTPAENTSQRKKISLKDYKSKDKSAVNTPERRPVGEDLRKEHFKSKLETESLSTRKEPELETEFVSTRKEPGMGKSSQEEVQASKGDSQRENKHDSQPRNVKSSPRKPQDEAERISPRPNKRRKLSIDSPSLSENDKSARNLKPNESKPLPTLLSPTVPGEERRNLQLPTLLSPKLPPGLDKVISASANQRSDEVRSVLKASIGSPAPADKKSANSPSKDSPNRGRSESLLSVKGASGNIAKLQSPALKPQSVSKPGTPGTSPRPRQRHTIVLKYGKKNRKRVEALLKFKARPKKVPVVKDDAAPAIKATKNEPVPQEKKRSTDQDSERPSKKQMTHSSRETQLKPERPSTPLGNLTGSPLASATKMKSAFSTPKKDLKSTAMQRVASTDTNEARTPIGDIAKSSTPMSSSQLTKASPGPSLNSVKTEDRAAWTEMNEKYFGVGRTLKREGSKLAGDGSSKDHSLSVVLLVEGLLCFMLNSGAQSQARPNADPGWSTIIPYHIMVFKQSRRYRHLHGLVVQLGAVCRQYVQNEDMRRLAREPFPDDSLGSAPTPGSDGTTKTNHDPERYKKRYLEFRDNLVQNARELQTAWLDGTRILSLEVLERDYPKTWKSRAKDASKRNPEKLNPKGLSKEYFLPIDVTTNVFEATNFAMAFMKEWTQQEGIKWEPRIDL